MFFGNLNLAVAPFLNNFQEVGVSTLSGNIFIDRNKFNIRLAHQIYSLRRKFLHVLTSTKPFC